MERIIKFRGWNTKNDKWIYGYYFVNRGEPFIVEDGILTNPFLTADDFKVEENTIGQFTGLTDALGNDIYEGDVLSDGCTVEWHDQGFVLHNKFGHFPLWESNIDENVVVWNIYKKGNERYRNIQR